MNDGGRSPYEPIPAELIRDIASRLRQGKAIRENLPGNAQLNIDRPLPFLCVYRRNPARSDAGTHFFVRAEAAFLDASGDAPVRQGLQALIRCLAATASQRFGGFLILEIWSADDRQVPTAVHAGTGEKLLPPAAFRIYTRQPHQPEGTVAKLKFELQRIHIHRQPADVEIQLKPRNHTPGMKQLISAAEAARWNCHVLGLEVRPIHRDPQSGEVYADLLRRLRRGVGRALKKAFFTFAINRTNLQPQHFYALGRKKLSQSVWDADRRLAEVSAQFNFLLQVTPVNAERAWLDFQESGFCQNPVFQYRPLRTDPLPLKRRLLMVRTENIEDPTMAHLLRQTQDELDRQITMLADIGTPCFLPGSLQVYGGVAPALRATAEQILMRLPTRQDTSREPQIGARQFARRAAREIAYYRQRLSAFTAQAQVRQDMYNGLLSSGGNLLIGRETSVPLHRVQALLQHEIGTHLVTYYNGQAQPLRLLRAGLAGYDGLQEGLAVLSEYLVGGLSGGRLRLLAARVMAAELMIGGAEFSDTFQVLVNSYVFDARTAYTITLRTYRGGGLTKDAIYLQGLVDILRYLQGRGELEPLFVGKIAVEHIPLIRELRLRQVLHPPPLRPRFLDHPETAQRLARVADGLEVVGLVEPRD